LPWYGLNMSSPIERTSPGDLNGAARAVVLPGQRIRSGSAYPLVKSPLNVIRGYEWAELAERADVSIATLLQWVLAGHFRPCGIGTRGIGTHGVASRGVGFAAVDVVRLAALARLVRSGVPLARAAALASTPE
jgi:hypothetical protein